MAQHCETLFSPRFNIAVRNDARFSAAFYGPLAARDDLVASPEKRSDA
jgi:hypothetical protein